MSDKRLLFVLKVHNNLLTWVSYLPQFGSGDANGDPIPMPEAKDELPREEHEGPLLPVPAGIRPTLARYRLEVRQLQQNWNS